MDASALAARDRRALQSVATQFFVNGAIFASISPRLPEIRTRLDVSTGTLGLLLAAGGAAGLLGSISVGRLVERFGSRRVLIGGALVLVTTMPVIGYATEWWMFLVGMMLLSSFDVLVDSSMNLQGSWLSGRRDEPVMNRLHGLWSLGTVVGGLAASRVAAVGISLQIHLVVVALILLAVIVFVGSGLLVEDEYEPDETSVDGVTVVKRGARRMLTLMAIIGGCSIAMELTSSDWAAFRLTDDLGATPGVAGLGFVGFTAGMTIGRLAGDAVQVRLGLDRLFRVGVVLALAGLLLATSIDQTVIVVVGFLVAGLGVATQFPKLYDDAARLPGRPGAGLGALTGGSRIALLIVPVLVGGLAGTALSVGAAIAIVTLPALAAFVLVERMIGRERLDAAVG
ncbi:MAG: MFS transporter [Actinomycetota bacterium]